ncbi:MAG: hypothetical protein HUN04_24870 [Desulfobacter sp.]|nr:MAG: hypothetical protein HUN04_24870 [Desulfobacter sp.]
MGKIIRTAAVLSLGLCLAGLPPARGDSGNGAGTDKAAAVKEKITKAAAKAADKTVDAGRAVVSTFNGFAQTYTGAPEEENVPTARRDPFGASEKLRRAKEGPLQPAARPRPERFGFKPRAEQPKEMPKMKLKGHLKGRNGEVVALLEIKGGDVYIVREGDTVGLHDLGIDSVIRIQEISRRHLVVESGTLGTVIIVR